MARLASRRIVVTPPITKQWENDVTASPETTIVLVTRDKKKHKALESAKRDIRARCVTCICLILICALCLGVVSIVLMVKTNSGLLSEKALNDGITTMEPVENALYPTNNAALHGDSAILHGDSTGSMKTADSKQAMTTKPADSVQTAVDDSTPVSHTNDSGDDTPPGMPVTGGDSTNSWQTAADTKLMRKAALNDPSPLTSPILATPRFTTQKMTPTDSVGTRCVPVRQSVPSCQVLPYHLTAEEANHTAHRVIDSFFFDPKDKCHPDWLFFICAYMLPECKTVPPSSDWKPRCLCPDFNATIFKVKRCAGRELGKKGVEQDRLTCDGRAEPSEQNCLKP